MHSCTKGTHTAGSHHVANYRSKDTTLVPTEGSSPSPMTPTPTNDNKLYIWKPNDLQLLLSAQRVLYYALSGEKREEGERRGKETSSEHIVFSSKVTVTIWLKHPKIFMKFVVLPIDDSRFF